MLWDAIADLIRSQRKTTLQHYPGIPFKECNKFLFLFFFKGNDKTVT